MIFIREKGGGQVQQGQLYGLVVTSRLTVMDCIVMRFNAKTRTEFGDQAFWAGVSPAIAMS